MRVDDHTLMPIPDGEEATGGLEDADERASLPWVPLTGLIGSGGFALWTSLTCFVC